MKIKEIKKEIVSFDDVKSVMKFLHQPTIKIAETLTGILSSDSKDWKLSTGKIMQSVIKGNLLTQLGREMKKYHEEGKIKGDYLESDINRVTFKELLKFIDDESPDKIRFMAMKSIFFSSLDGESELLAYQFMQICKKLSSAEILILKANYQIVKNTGEPLEEGISFNNRRVDNWSQVISKKIGHNLPEIVLQYENSLMDLKLISGYYYPTGRKDVIETDFSPTSHFRLTNLGYKLCEFIIKYEN